MTWTYIAQNGLGTAAVPGVGTAFAPQFAAPQFAAPQFAAPQFAAPQFAPQGLFGNVLGGIAPVIGGAIGGDAGRWINTIGSTVGSFLPFSASPFQTPVSAPFQSAGYPVTPFAAAPQLAPQGIFGSILGGITPAIGNAIGGDAGRWINTIGSTVSSLLPFSATPFGASPYAATPFAATPFSANPFATPLQAAGYPAYSAYPTAVPTSFIAPQTAAQFAPQGIFGNLLSGITPVIGNTIGGDAGRWINTIGSTVGSFLPFQAAPNASAFNPAYSYVPLQPVAVAA